MGGLPENPGIIKICPFMTDPIFQARCTTAHKLRVLFSTSDLEMIAALESLFFEMLHFVK